MSTSTPVSVTTMVCSNCAERLPSVVVEVQLSPHKTSCQVPVESKRVLGGVETELVSVDSKKKKMFNSEEPNQHTKRTNVNHGLDGKDVADLHNAGSLVFGVVRHVRGAMEELVDAVTAVRAHDRVVGSMCSLGDDVTEVSVRHTRPNCNRGNADKNWGNHINK